MIVLEHLKKLKNAVKEETDSFHALLEKVSETKLEGTEETLHYFTTVVAKEQGSYLHLMYNKQHMNKNKWEDFYIQTRALVLDWKTEEIILYPFEKFFELDEHPTSTLKQVKKRMNEAEYIETTEKIDGSLIVARFYKGEHFLVTTGSFEGPHVDIARRILKTDVPLQQMMQVYADHTFMLEMKNIVSPQLIKYGEDKMTIIGMRDMRTNRLLTRTEIAQIAQEFGASVAPQFDLTVDEMLAIMEDPNTTNNEGYILRIDDFFVKMKTKNFILAARFSGDPARNFNMVIQCIEEGRLEAVRHMVTARYLEGFDRLAAVILNYANQKEEVLHKMLEALPKDGAFEDFVAEANRKFFPHVKNLVSLKKGYYEPFTKKDLKRLKPIAQYFGIVAHYKYAEQNELPLEQVEKDIEDGKILYLERYDDKKNDRIVYIIPKWQWFKEDMVPHYE